MFQIHTLPVLMDKLAGIIQLILSRNGSPWISYTEEMFQSPKKCVLAPSWQIDVYPLHLKVSWNNCKTLTETKISNCGNQATNSSHLYIYISILRAITATIIV